MSSEFQRSKLEALVTFSNGRSSPDRFEDGAFPVYGSNGLIGLANEVNAPAQSIVIGRVGSYCGSVHFSWTKCWVTDNAIRATAKGNNDSSFLYYLLKHLDLNNWRSGSGQPLLNQATLNSIEVSVPPPSDQKRIGGFIASIDDRITLLRETNATLEAIAQAMFKSWFVDFDPVRAKAEGHQPKGMDAPTAALFPDSFEESELGLVPKGWGIKSVAEVAEVVKGKSYTSKELAETHDTALVTLKSFARGGGFRLDGFKPYTGSYKPAQVVVPGDLIIAYTDVTQAAELIGKPAIVIGVEDYQTLVASLDVGIVRPDIQKVSRQYLYGLFRTDSFQSHTFAHTSGTTVLHLAKDGVGSYQFSCPPSDIIQSFSVITDALSERCQNNIDQVRNLTQLRDTLLPRLISGQLRLPEAEQAVEEALA